MLRQVHAGSPAVPMVHMPMFKSGTHIAFVQWHVSFVVPLEFFMRKPFHASRFCSDTAVPPMATGWPALMAVATLALCAAGLSTSASAQAVDAAASGHGFDLTANVTVASQYRYRGIMQTNNKPALQGGFDVTHSSGFYIGNWNSTISWLDDTDPDVSAPLEMDFYGGFRGNITPDVTFDVGVLQYYYPGGYTSPDTTEAYAGIGYGPVSFKYSHAFTNLFGVPDSKNSQYYDLRGSFETGVWGLNLDAHVGYQKVRNLDDGSYTDWSLGVSKAWGRNITTTLAYIDTNADRNVYVNSSGRYTGRATALLSVTASF